jgi:hypothetical protein
MKTEDKVAMLANQLRTKELVARIPILEEELRKALNDEILFRSKNYDYLARSGEDCPAVKEFIADLYAQAQGKNQAERDAWLLKQRKTNEPLQKLIIKQREASFVADDFKVKIEIAKRSLDNVIAVLSLRTAQIHFLSSGGG